MKTVPRPLFLDTFRRRVSELSLPGVCAAFVALAVLPQGYALPVGGQVVAGHVTMSVNGPQLTLDQASRTAIMNWQQFNIAPNEAVRIHQTGADAALLARVTGGNPSELLGQLNADGKLFLINPRGILVGQGAVIDTGSFLASTLDVADADFLKGGPLAIQGDSAAGVVNLGRITAREGNVLIFAHTVKNAGEISAAKGTAGLGAGTEVNLASPDESVFVIKFNLPATTAKTGVDNSGVITAAQAQLEAAGGSIYDLAVNQSGAIRATGVERLPDGRVRLTAGGGNVVVTGNVSARQADGSGGEILVGGDFQGKNAAVANAARTYVGPEARLDASSASATGDGGRVIVWADDTTRFAGALEAKAGAQGGDGGFAEVSGKHLLGFTGTADLSAPQGAGGGLLLDPDNLTIVAGTATAANLTADNTWAYAEDPGSQTLGATTLAGLLLANNVTLQASDTLTVSSPVAVASGGISGATLTLQASTLAINQGISLANVTNGQIQLFHNSSGPGTSLTSASGATLEASKILIGEMPTVTLNGPVVSSQLTYNSLGSPASFSATHANNDIAKFILNTDVADPQAVTFSGSVAVNSESSLQVQALVGGASGVTFSTAGDLTMLGVDGITPATSIASSGPVKLASTGGVLINQAGTGLFSGSGRRLLYTSNVDGSYSLGGLTGFNEFNHITYPNDPQSAVTLVLYNAAGAAASVLTITADDFVRLYGQANPAFTASYAGGTAADLTTLPTLSIQGGPAVNVGTYTIVPSGAASSTHTLTYVNGTLKINPATLTYVANPVSRSYGAVNPLFGGTVTGFVNGDTLASATTGTLAFGTTAAPFTNAGSQALTGSGLTANSGNYVFTQAAANATAFTITRAPLGLGGVAVSAVYGDPVTLAYNVTGLLGSDTATVLSGVSFNPLPANAAPGTYFLSFSSTGTATNYVVTGTLPAIVSIERRPITISSDNVSSIAGALPPFTTRSSLVPLAGGPQFTIRATTTATSASPAGTYAITPVIVPADGTTFADVERYYAVTVNPGTLTLSAPVVDAVNLRQIVIPPAETGDIMVTGPAKIVADLEKTFEQPKAKDVVVTRQVSGSLPLTPRLLRDAVLDFGPDLLAILTDFTSDIQFVENTPSEQMQILYRLAPQAAQRLSLEELADLVATDPVARAAIMPLLARVSVTAITSGRPLTYEQQVFVARISENVNKQRQSLEAELVTQRLEFEKQKSTAGTNNAYALKTMPDLAISAQQATTEKVIAAAIGAGVGLTVGGAAAALLSVSSVAGAILPFGALTAAGSTSALVASTSSAAPAATGVAGGTAGGIFVVAVAVIVIGVVSAVMVAQEQQNINAYDAALARARTPVDLKASGLDLKNDPTAQTEFFTAFMATMLETGITPKK